MQSDGTTPKLMSPWPLGLAGRLPHPGLSVSLAVGAVTLVYYVVSGAWFPEEYSQFWTSPRQITGMALTYILILSYLSGFFIYAARRTTECANELRPLFTGIEAETLVAGLNRMPVTDSGLRRVWVCYWGSPMSICGW